MCSIACVTRARKANAYQNSKKRVADGLKQGGVPLTVVFVQQTIRIKNSDKHFRQASERVLSDKQGDTLPLTFGACGEADPDVVRMILNKNVNIDPFCLPETSIPAIGLNF